MVDSLQVSNDGLGKSFSKNLILNSEELEEDRNYESGGDNVLGSQLSERSDEEESNFRVEDVVVGLEQVEELSREEVKGISLNLGHMGHKLDVVHNLGVIEDRVVSEVQKQLLEGLEVLCKLVGILVWLSLNSILQLLEIKDLCVSLLILLLFHLLIILSFSSLLKLVVHPKFLLLGTLFLRLFGVSSLFH